MTSRRGMTLLEVMVAFAIIGLMVAAGTQAFSSIIDHRQTVLTANSATERAAALREQLHSWLTAGTITTPAAAARVAAASQNLLLIGATGQMLTSVAPAIVTGDDINFITRAPNPLQSDTCIMRLFIDDDLNTPERGLTMEYRLSSLTPLMRTQLDTTIVALTVEYLDTTTLQWVASQNAATITAPKAVRVTFSDSLYNSMLSVPMVIPMTAPAAAGAIPGGGAGG